jgi:D-cysteine desulfhydrase
MKRRDFCLALPASLVAAAASCTPAAPRLARSLPPGPIQPARVLPAAQLPATPHATPAPGPGQPEVIPLFRQYPMLGEKLPYVPLGLLPTPIEKATELGRQLGIAELYVKRDDQSGGEYGGGKVRKLEFFLADAKRQGKRTVVTSGAVGSNHALATTIYARQLDLHTILMLLPQPPSRHVRHNLLADAHFGGELRPDRSAPPSGSAGRALHEADAYVIPAGGSSPLGNAGFVNTAFELRAQIEQGLLPEPDVVYLALGTMGSAAGLIVGLKAAGLKTKVVSVRASTPNTASEGKLALMLRQTNDYLRSLDPAFPRLSFANDDAMILHSYVGGGYAVPTAKGTRAAQLFEEQTGVALETTYTGKAFAAVMDDAPALAGKVVLFWNSYNSRKIDLGTARIEDVPPPFRAYFHGAPRGQDRQE